MKTLEKIFRLIFFTFMMLMIYPVFSQTDSLKCDESISNFIEAHWKRKSKVLVEDFEDSYFNKIKPCLIGKTKQEIESLFGNASEDDITGLTYYIDKKPKDTKETKVVVFVLDASGICTSTYKLISLPIIY